ncbi:MAG: hypothetical protein KF865_00100 [Bdellovibrionaceae bacterium]|nr:hypothetical protein [Pseudobdellovibrionaceae bacterium]
MKSSYSSLMQSKYFSPAFNSAIFDGPVRIYFAQFHEALALKIYFLIQQKWPQEFSRAKELSRSAHANVLVMLYPTDDSFMASVNNDAPASARWVVEGWNEDAVIALRGPLEDHEIESFLSFAGEVLRNWTPRSLESGRGDLGLVSPG